MALVEVSVQEINGLKLPDEISNSKVFVMLQNSERYNIQKSNYYDYSESIKVDETFSLSSKHPLIDSIIISLFYRTEIEKYNPIGTCKFMINKLHLSKELNQKLPIFSFFDDVETCGEIAVNFVFNDLNEMVNNASANNLLLSKARNSSKGRLRRFRNKRLENNSDYSDSLSDSDDIPLKRRPRKRIRGDHHTGKVRILTGVSPDDFQFKPKAKRKELRRKIAELKEAGIGDTMGSITIQQKEKLLNATLQKYKIDPEKLKVFAEIKTLLEKNNEILDIAKEEGRAIENGVFKAELSKLTMMSISDRIENTKAMIDKLKKEKSERQKQESQQASKTPTQVKK